MAEMPTALWRPPQSDAHAAVRAPEAWIVGAKLVLLFRAQQVQLADLSMEELGRNMNFPGMTVAYFFDEALFNDLGQLWKVGNRESAEVRRHWS